MMSPSFPTIAQIAVGRILNSLPEGLLLALFVWMMLRLLPRQNSGTRFALWFVALLAVAALPLAGLPLVGDILSGHTVPVFGGARPVITIPGSWGSLLFLAWILAAWVALLRLAIGLWRLRDLRRSCTAIDPAELDIAIQKTVGEFSSRQVTLAASENVSVPAAIGFFKPMVVIPGWALRELPPEELNIILLHEFAHLRRWDDWTNLLQKVVRAIFLFHPAVWWIDGRLALEREMACDDEVLAGTGNPRGYANCLISLLEKSFARRGWTMAQAAVHRAREASLRLAQILDERRPHARNIWKPALGMVAAFSLACLMVVPRVPELVAFDRHVPEIVGSDVHAAPLAHFQFPAAAVVPAALHIGPPSIEKAPRHSAQVARHVNQHPVHQHLADGASVPPAIAINATDAGSSPLEVVNVGANGTVVPAETLLVVRTTQRVGANSWVWSVSMWRITWVNLEQDEAAKAPATKKT
jgi:beta-lactamase regulating signal transducer with metallopeptidase domain